MSYLQDKQKVRYTVDFMLKIICVKIFRVDKFSQFVQSAKIFLTVDGYIMDERLERSLHYRETQLSLVTGSSELETVQQYGSTVQNYFSAFLSRPP